MVCLYVLTYRKVGKCRPWSNELVCQSK